MFLKAIATVALFTGLLGAADIFSVRSFLDPKTKAKMPLNELFAAPEKAVVFIQAKSHECAIPLVEATPAKTNDGIAQFAGPNKNAKGVVPPPVPTCKGWN